MKKMHGATSILTLLAGTMVAGGALAATTCGTAPVKLTTYAVTGFKTIPALGAEFTKQFPNVTFDNKTDEYSVLVENSPRYLAGDSPPDLITLPFITDAVADGLLKNLDGYFKEFGWDKFPPSQLLQMRVAKSGKSRGSGSLYQMGLNYSVTGVFYNKTLAAKIGMTAAPKTLAELDALMAKAKAAGILPIIQFNKGTAGLVFPLQNLMGSYGPPEPINDWIFLKPGATIDTPSNLKAAQHLEQWIKAGYFSSDANSVDYGAMMSRFIAGKALFMFNGDWESGNLDKQMTGNVGFFLMPPVEAGGRQAAMSGPYPVVIGAHSKHADCAAFFINWVATNKAARRINVDVAGSNPGGPPDLPIPSVTPGSVTEATLAAGKVIAADDGTMDFIANATGAIFAAGWTPEVQKMVGGRQDAAGLLKAVQAEYEKELSR